MLMRILVISWVFGGLWVLGLKGNAEEATVYPPHLLSWEYIYRHPHEDPKQYNTEGYYNDPREKKIYLIDRFLPYNPNIVCFQCSQENYRIMQLQWPHCAFYAADPLKSHSELPCDLLWVECGGAELVF